jgi:hypothetical protein
LNFLHLLGDQVLLLGGQWINASGKCGSVQLLLEQLLLQQTQVIGLGRLALQLLKLLVDHGEGGHILAGNGGGEHWQGGAE